MDNGLHMGLSLAGAGLIYGTVLFIANLGRLKDIVKFGKQIAGKTE